tara:strand:- start:32131 stop:33111 length:981 start_codon:yes stop_codon:yes gene_type:complete
MDIVLIFLVTLEVLGYFLWIFFTQKKQSSRRDIVSSLMFIVALVILYKVFTLNLDFGLVLIIGTCLAGISWALGHVVSISDLREESRSYFLILLIITCIRSFTYEPYQIPSRSMEPGLQIGDFVLVNKFVYGLKFPGTNNLITELRKPKRNEVAVFYPPHTICSRSPLDARPDLDKLSLQEGQLFLSRFSALQDDRCTASGIKYVKRIIGIPGDKVILKGYELWINDKKISKVFLKNLDNKIIYEETINNLKHFIQLDGSNKLEEYKWQVPEGKYLAIGDNRDNSLDSRSWGYFSEDHLVGRADFIWLHWPSFAELPSLRRNGKIN